MGSGGRGEITAKIQKLFFEITKAERRAPGDWLTFVNAEKTAGPENNGHKADTVTNTVSAQGNETVKYQNAVID